MFVCGTRRETLERLSMTYVYGKRQTVGSCVSQKDENLRFFNCLLREPQFVECGGDRYGVPNFEDAV